MSPATPASAVTVPLLETPRLILREYRASDFEPFARHLSDPVSAEFLGVVDRPTAWRFFCSHVGMWQLYGAGWWSVTLREGGEPAGHVGAFLREGHNGLELGWSIYRPFWGQGLAGEAAATVLDYAFQTRREPQVHALIDPGNIASRRVAERLGLRFDGNTELHGKPVERYVRSATPSEA